MLFKRIFIFYLTCIFLMIPSISMASPSSIEKISHEIMQDEQGNQYLHIELNTNRELKDFSINFNPNNQKQLIFRLGNATISNISHQEKLDKTIAKKIFIHEIDGNFVQGKIYLKEEANNNFKIYSLGKNGVAIDIFTTPINDTVITDTNIANLKNKIITIDPGHGGSDSGAIGPNGYSEKEATLAIATDLKDILTGAGAKVIMTRDTDSDVFGANASAINELQARVNVANNHKSDIMVSIHCNAFTSPSANGTQTFYYPSSYKGQRLAQNIQQKMIEANGLTDRGASTCNFYVVKKSFMPAVLIETAFITNYNEEALLSDPDWQMQLANAIAQGISQYFSEQN